MFSLSPRAVELLRQQRLALRKEELAAVPGTYKGTGLVPGRARRAHQATRAYRRLQAGGSESRDSRW